MIFDFDDFCDDVVGCDDYVVFFYCVDCLVMFFCLFLLWVDQEEVEDYVDDQELVEYEYGVVG